MNYFDQCKRFTKKYPINIEKDIQQSTSLILDKQHSKLTTYPFIKKSEYLDEDMEHSVFYISDLHLDNHIISKFKDGASNKEIVVYIKNIVASLFSTRFINDVKRNRQPIVLFGGDISSNFALNSIFYKEFMKEFRELAKNKKVWRVYAILGNHEFWDFKTYEECISAYSSLFESLEICFLNSNLYYFGNFNNARYWIIDKEGENEEEKEKIINLRMMLFANAVIVGGVGFATENNFFNAKQNIYGKAIDTEKEKTLADEWLKKYHEAVDISKKMHTSLIVLTHMPFNDWLPKNELPANCFFINGHTHKNYTYQDEKRNFKIIANNQIGYKSSRFIFKKATIYKPRNPFASFANGYYEISINDYNEFHVFMNMGVQNTGTIELQMTEFGKKLYVIKQDNYYGFFMTAPKAMCICNGGAIRKIGKNPDISKYNEKFLAMVKTYLAALYPLRKVQEKISEIVKAFGGNGDIHGSIVDIDFFNHVMINPNDGSITYYYSPFFGYILPYQNLQSLIHDKRPELEQKFIEKNSAQLIESIDLPTNFTKNEYEIIDIKNSPYGISRRISALQRLFDKHVLRDWNEDLLNQEITDKSLLLNG